MGKKEFLEFVKDASKEFSETLDGGVHIITHVDADGLSSVILFLKYLYDIGIPTKVSFVKYLSEKYIEDLKDEEINTIVFLDLGSQYYNKIKEVLDKRKVFILDHHDISSKERREDNIFQINPRLFGLNGERDISTSGISYLFIKNIYPYITDFGYLALTGAIGDVQETNDGFVGINKEILEELKELDIIEIKKGLKAFGLLSRPLYKVLEYSTEIYIPGVTGSESGAIKLLQEQNIPIKRGGEWVKYLDLTDEEKRRLITGIVLRRLQAKIPNAEDVLGNLYIIKPMKDKGYFNEVRELSYVLNACGRFGKYSVGVGLVFGDEKFQDMAIDIIMQYKKEILQAIQMISNGNVERKEYGKLLLINYGDSIRDTLVSPIATIFSTDNYFPNYRVIVVAALESEDSYKISARSIGPSNGSLALAVKRAAEKVGGVGGGHDNAAGASIPKESLDSFIRELRIQLRQQSIFV